MVFSPFFVFFRLLENSVKSSKRAIFSSNRSESFDSGKGSATLGLFSVQKLLPSEVVSKSVLKALDGEMIQFNFHRERKRWKRFFILPLSKSNDQNSIIMCNQIKLRNVPFRQIWESCAGHKVAKQSLSMIMGCVSAWHQLVKALIWQLSIEMHKNIEMRYRFFAFSRIPLSSSNEEPFF